MKKTGNISVKGNRYEPPRLSFAVINEDVVTSSKSKMSWGLFGDFQDTRENTFIGGEEE